MSPGSLTNSGIHRQFARLTRSLRRLAGRPGTARGSKPVWRRVGHGPLEGLEFLLPPPGADGWADRIVAGTYEPGTLAVLEQLASKSGVLYDIGAHIGFFTCAWIRMGGRSVEAFEPLPSNAAVLKDIVARNGISAAVRVHAFALGNDNARVRLLAHALDLGTTSMAFVEDIGGIRSQARSERYRLAEPTAVALRRLDDVLADEKLPPPDVLKIDVEGAEPEVLAGAESLLARLKPAVVCEVHNIDGGLRVSDQMARLDYRLQIIGWNNMQTAALWRTGEDG